MSRKKQHIDKLFKEGLKNFSLLVTDKDLDAIDDKASVFKDKSGEISNKGFDNFELEVTDMDWLATKAKLENEKQTLVNDTSINGTFENFEIEPHPSDWQITFDKYKSARKKRIAFWWWLSTGIIILVAGLSVLLKENPENKNQVGQLPGQTETNSKIESQNSVDSEHKNAGLRPDDIAGSDIENPNVKTSVPESVLPDHATSVKSSNTQIHNGTYSGNSGKIHKAGKALSNSYVKSSDPAEILQEVKPGLSDNSSKESSVISNGNTNSETSSDIGSGSKVNSGVGKNDETFISNSVQPDEKKNENSIVKINEPLKPADKKDTSIKESDKKQYSSPAGFYVGMVNQVARTYRYLSPSNNDLYNSIRNASDKRFMQYFAGLEFGYLKGKNRWSVGVNATKQIWKSSYDYTYKIYDSLPVYNPQSQLIGYLLVRPRDTTMHESSVIKISRVEIPVEYSRSFAINQRFSINTGIGAVFGFNTSVKGDKIIYSRNRQLYYYNRWSNMESSFSFAPSVNMGVQYRLSKQFMIQSSLFGNMYANSRFKTLFAAKDYPYSIGLNIKLIYLLNKQTFKK